MDRVLEITLGLLAIFVILLLVGLVADVITSKSCIDWGTVVDLRYEPERTYTTTETYIDSDGHTQLRTVTKTDDEDWIAVIRLEKLNSVESFEIKKSVYYRLQIGSSVKVNYSKGGMFGIRWNSSVKLEE